MCYGGGREYTVADFHGASLYLVQIIITATISGSVYIAEIWLQVFKKKSGKITVRNPRQFSDHKAGHYPQAQQCNLRSDF